MTFVFKGQISQLQIHVLPGLKLECIRTLQNKLQSILGNDSFIF